MDKISIEYKDAPVSVRIAEEEYKAISVTVSRDSPVVFDLTGNSYYCSSAGYIEIVVPGFIPPDLRFNTLLKFGCDYDKIAFIGDHRIVVSGEVYQTYKCIDYSSPDSYQTIEWLHGDN